MCAFFYINERKLGFEMKTKRSLHSIKHKILFLLLVVVQNKIYAFYAMGYYDYGKFIEIYN